MLRSTYDDVNTTQGKVPLRSDFKWTFPRICEDTEQLRCVMIPGEAYTYD